ncbi:uncharacterized protein B0H64DRAFT_217648 [Chaetomium fimeti]|uniref:Uncharacterized protein n=1 Tax=Chaetomium fimeti TaxID=1854472 RepID=A0AAE0HBY4_9PEZI|nr:hypothetical protein B0H64DRAFT_217648 [Chaetomium fimeti]
MASASWSQGAGTIGETTRDHSRHSKLPARCGQQVDARRVAPKTREKPRRVAYSNVLLFVPRRYLRNPFDRLKNTRASPQAVPKCHVGESEDGVTLGAWLSFPISTPYLALKPVLVMSADGGSARNTTLRNTKKNRELLSATAAPELAKPLELGGLTLALRGVSVSHSSWCSARTGFGGVRAGPYLACLAGLQRGVATTSSCEEPKTAVPWLALVAEGSPVPRRQPLLGGGVLTVRRARGALWHLLVQL